MAYTDESGKLYVGRELTVPEFREWWAAQNLGRAPFNAVGIHHTYRPDGAQWTGVGRLKAVFDDYYHRRGWRPWGVGPHLWLYCGDGAYKRGQQLVYVGTHPRHDGYGIVTRNRRWLHIEAIGYYDFAPMPEAMLELYRAVVQTVCGDRIPIRNCKPGADNPSHPLGLMFHRDEPGQTKSCPGWKVGDGFFEAMRSATPKPPPIPPGSKLFRDCGRAEGVPRLTAKPARLAADANVRRGASTKSEIVYTGTGTEVRVLGYDEGEEVGGSDRWYLVRAGYATPGAPDTLGYAHCSVLTTRGGKPFEGAADARKAPRLCSSPAALLGADNVRRHTSTGSAVVCTGPEEDVRVVGREPGRSVGGDATWYLARVGYERGGARPELGYVHSSVLYEREVG